MAKKNESLVVAESTANPLALPDDMMKAPAVVGAAAPPRLSRRLKLFQGNQTERENYPGLDVKPGDWIDTLNACVVTPKTIIPLCCRMRYAWWPKGKQRPEYESLAWNDPEFSKYLNRDPRVSDTQYNQTTNTPPLISPIYDFLVLMDDDPTPLLVSFKKTGATAGNQAHAILESSRKAGKIPVLRLSVKSDQDGDGNKYVKPVVGLAAYVSDPAVVQLVVEVWRMYHDQVQAMPVGDDDHGSKEIPI